MKCTNCGFENRADAHFCKQCGQPLPAQPTPPAGVICPACGATAKPGALFCPRCGKPLPDSKPPSTPPPHISQEATRPSLGPLPQPYGPPPAPPPQKQRRSSRWPLWVAGIIAFACIVAIAGAAVFVAPKYIGPQETPTTTPAPTVPPPSETPPPPTATPAPSETPPPAVSVQVAITASVTELRVGESLTVTITITNAGDVPLGNLRYRLLDWEPFFTPPAGQEVIHETEIPPGGSDTALFELEAAQPGAAQIFAAVTVETREEQPAHKAASSQVLEITVIQ